MHYGSVFAPGLFAGKVVVITGGGSGIGRCTAHELAALGATVALIGRKPEKLEKAAAEIAEDGGKVSQHVCDIRNEEAVKACVAAIVAQHGRIDGLVNNAGTNDGVGLEAGPAAFRASLDQNLLHYYTLAHLLQDDLKAQCGAIVNISSKTAVTGQGTTSAYVAAKAAQLGLTREWTAALAPWGVRVNAVIPAEVLTPMYEAWLQSFPDPAAQKALITARIPLGQRMTEAAELAATAVFALSPRSAHTTGQWLFVDGGYTHLDRALGR